MLAVIGAHPDDAELEAGGLLARDGGIIICLTNGQNHTRNSYVADQEQGAAAEILNVRYFNLGYKVLTVVTQEMVRQIDAIIASEGVTGVITHTVSDSNQEHRITGEAATAASRCLRNLAYFEPIPPARGPFTPQLYADISKVAEKKYQAVWKYASQIHRHGMDLLESRKALDAWRGCEMNVTAAECFQVERWTL